MDSEIIYSDTWELLDEAIEGRHVDDVVFSQQAVYRPVRPETSRLLVDMLYRALQAWTSSSPSLGNDQRNWCTGQAHQAVQDVSDRHGPQGWHRRCRDTDRKR